MWKIFTVEIHMEISNKCDYECTFRAQTVNKPQKYVQKNIQKGLKITEIENTGKMSEISNSR